MKKKFLEVVHRASFEVMKKAAIELTMMKIRDMPPIPESEINSELHKMGQSFMDGCGRCPACLARKAARQPN
jgi:hypothetical protein